MKLAALIETYIGFKHSMGMRLRAQATILKAYGRAMGDVDISEVQPKAVLAFISGHGPITAHWASKFSTLRGFYRFVVSRDYAATTPLPTNPPKLPPPFQPYIYSVDELKRLLAATDSLQLPYNSPLQALTFRNLLLLLYGTGMRIGEALSLTLSDVDLVDRLITVHDAKFFKSRWVPLGCKLTQELLAYAARRQQLALPAGECSAFFATRTGHFLRYPRVHHLFHRVRQVAGVRRESGARYQPRIHDIRHTAAVHRLIAWYRGGLDVQRLLPQLATYMGHLDLRSTQHYLTLTPELLSEACLRFEQYAFGEIRHD